MNKQQLASKIWQTANKMRSKIEANDYKDYILGFIFYKYLSDKEVNYLLSHDWEEEDIYTELNDDEEDAIADLQKNLGYYIPGKCLYNSWLKERKTNQFKVGHVIDALNNFEYNVVKDSKIRNIYHNIFDTLSKNLTKLGGTPAEQSKSVKDIIELINDIPTDGKQGYDVLGYIYEYLISNFAANAGKKAGEFYTPHEVAVLMAEIVAEHCKGKQNIKVYDPTSGSGSLLFSVGSTISKYMDYDSIMYYAQELKENTYNLTRMNLVMRDIKPNNIVVRNGDTLEHDWPLFTNEQDPDEGYELLKVDAVVSNPPYSQPWEPDHKASDPRFAYGVAPKAKADYAFLLHCLYHLEADGIMTIVLPHGVLFRGGEEERIRKNLVDNNHIDTIIGLPPNIFFGTGIPTLVMVLKKDRRKDKISNILFIDASKGFEKDGKNNKLRACDIRRIADVIRERRSVEKFSRVVELEEIVSNGYNLNIPRYVDSSEEAEEFDIYATMFGGVPNSEIYKTFRKYFEAFPTLGDAIFQRGEFTSMLRDNLSDIIENNDDIRKEGLALRAKFQDNNLDERLIDNCETVNFNQLEQDLYADLFSKLKGNELIDPYSVYQKYYDQSRIVADDIEMIQQDELGFGNVRVVDPLMVIKKKGDKEVEVQDGWKGRIIPFDLIQKYDEKLKEIIKHINGCNDDIQSNQSEYEDAINSISDDDKEPILNDDGEIDTKKILALTKQISKKKKDDKTDFDWNVEIAGTCLESNKVLTKVRKEWEQKLESDTIKAIENLSDSDAKKLLHTKWCHPYFEAVTGEIDDIKTDIITKASALAGKYADSFAHIDSEISDAERELAEMLGDLTGSEADLLGIQEFQKLLNR